MTAPAGPAPDARPGPDRPGRRPGDRAAAAIFAPIEPPIRLEKAVERLARAIALGLLPPGSKLPPERELAAQMQISRVTLRHAITALQQSGLVSARRGRGGGTWVDPSALRQLLAGQPLDPDWREVLDLRVVVEVGASLLAAQRATSEVLDALDEMIVAMDGALAYEDYRQLDIRFHLGIAEATGSARLIEAVAEGQARMTSLFCHVPRPVIILEQSNAQHRGILRALRERDAVAAVLRTQEHVEGSRHVLAGLRPEAPEVPGDGRSRTGRTAS